MPHWFYILFLFALGASVGSFLNVVIGRFPLEETGRRFSWLAAISSPPSHCPKCGHGLAWYDNIPVLGWILLRGRCRYCRQPISIQYPLVEALTGGLFVFYYVMFFMAHVGPCAPEALRSIDFFGRITQQPRMPGSIQDDWPMYGLYMFVLCALLVITAIDARWYIIPVRLPWLLAGVGVVVHALWDTPQRPGALNLLEQGRPGIGAALAAGALVGLLASLLLLRLGWLPVSFAAGESALEIDQAAHDRAATEAKALGTEAPAPLHHYTPAQIRGEMRKEILFLMPPLIGAAIALALTESVPAVREAWTDLARTRWVSGALGAVLGAMVGALVVWLARILGSMAFGREAMGLGDVHLMFGVGACIGAGAATVAFFLAPFAGLVVGIYGWLTHRRRQIPYGPYLSLATAAVMLVYCPIAQYLAPGLSGLRQLLAGQ